jgi:hypothetical protein
MLNKRKAEETARAKEARKSYETLRESTVTSLIGRAGELHTQLMAFKALAFGEMNALYDMLQDYSRRHRDSKGNFTLTSADGTMKIRFSRQEYGSFDERAQQAEAHIIDFVNRQFSDSDSTRKLIMSLMERRKGALDVKLVQKLYAMEDDFQDEAWQTGLKLLRESWQPTDTRDYMTFHVQGKNKQWQAIDLNFSSVC